MPDESALQRDAIRELRGSILRMLQVFYIRNTTASEEMVRRHAMKICRATSAATAEALAYLADEGVQLIAREEEKMDGLDRDPSIFFRLKPRGYRVVTGVESDAGVVL